MSPNPIADRALPFVAPAIERVYRNSQHLGEISDRHESLAHMERHDHLRSIRDQHGSRLVPFAANRMSDGPIEERLLTMTRTSPESPR